MKINCLGCISFPLGLSHASCDCTIIPDLMIFDIDIIDLIGSFPLNVNPIRSIRSNVDHLRLVRVVRMDDRASFFHQACARIDLVDHHGIDDRIRIGTFPWRISILDLDVRRTLNRWSWDVCRDRRTSIWRCDWKDLESETRLCSRTPHRSGDRPTCGLGLDDRSTSSQIGSSFFILR